MLGALVNAKEECPSLLHPLHTSFTFLKLQHIFGFLRPGRILSTKVHSFHDLSKRHLYIKSNWIPLLEWEMINLLEMSRLIKKDSRWRCLHQSLATPLNCSIWTFRRLILTFYAKTEEKQKVAEQLCLFATVGGAGDQGFLSHLASASFCRDFGALYNSACTVYGQKRMRTETWAAVRVGEKSFTHMVHTQTSVAF